MPGPSDMSSKSSKNIKLNLEDTVKIKKEPSSSLLSTNIKDLKGSIDSLKLGSSSRLPSFRRPRDLTLSDLPPSTSAVIQPQARPKKTFQPNIPVRRDKVERVSESKSEKTPKKSINRSTHRDNVRGRGRGREKEFVQVKGTLFGEGIAAGSPLRRTSDIYGGGEGSRGSGSAKVGEMQKPVLNPDAAYNIDKDLEERKLKEILRDDFIDDPEDETAIESMPIQLPLVSKVPFPETKGKIPKVDTTSISTADSKDSTFPPVKVKKEPGLEDMPMEENAEEAYGPLLRGAAFNNYRLNLPEDSTAHRILSKLEVDMMNIQLPTALPAHPPDSVEGTDSSGSAISQFTSDKLAAEKPRCTLDSLPEGQLGKLRVYESGKVELCLCEHVFKVNEGVPRKFLQDVVCIEVDEPNKSGKMVVLGHVKDSYIVSADFDNMCNNLMNYRA